MGEVAGVMVTVEKAIAIPCPAELKAASNSLENSGKTVVWVSLAKEVIGIVAVVDTIKPEAANAIASLQQLEIAPTGIMN